MQRRIVGERHLKLLLKAQKSDQLIDAIAFNTVDDAWPDDVQSVDIAYKLAVNEYRGVLSPQLIVDYIEPVRAPEAVQ